MFGWHHASNVGNVLTFSNPEWPNVVYERKLYFRLAENYGDLCSDRTIDIGVRWQGIQWGNSKILAIFKDKLEIKDSEFKIILDAALFILNQIESYQHERANIIRERSRQLGELSLRIEDQAKMRSNIRNEIMREGVSTILSEGLDSTINYCESFDCRKSKISAVIKEKKYTFDILHPNFAPPEAMIYFLFKNSEVVYVGKSVQAWPARAVSHRDKDFDDAGFIPFPRFRRASLSELELVFIRKFNPKYNIAGKLDFVEQEAQYQMV